MSAAIFDPFESAKGPASTPTSGPIFDPFAPLPSKKPLFAAVNDSISALVPKNAIPEGVADPAGIAAAKADDEARAARIAAQRESLTPAGEGQVLRKVKAVGGGFVSALAQPAEYIGRKTGIAPLEELGQSGQDLGEALQPKDPTFADQLASGLGSTASFFIPGMAVAKGANLAARAAGLAPTIARGLATTIGTGVASGAETLGNAEQAFEDTLRNTGNRDYAEAQALKDAAINLPINYVADRLGIMGATRQRAAAKAFADATKGGAAVADAEKAALEAASRVRFPLAKDVAAAAGAESFQEGAQQVTGNILAHNDTGAGVAESALIGGIIGGGFGGVHSALSARTLTQPQQSVATPAAPSESEAVPAPPGSSATPPAQTVDPAQRLVELTAISKGTPDRTITGPEGQPIVVPGEPGRYFTPAEQAEYDALRTQVPVQRDESGASAHPADIATVDAGAQKATWHSDGVDYPVTIIEPVGIEGGREYVRVRNHLGGESIVPSDELELAAPPGPLAKAAATAATAPNDGSMSATEQSRLNASIAEAAQNRSDDQQLSALEQQDQETRTRQAADLEQQRTQAAFDKVAQIHQKNAEDQQRRQESALEAADARVAAQRQQQAEAQRRSLLDSVLDDQDVQNPVGKFAAALRNAGYQGEHANPNDTEMKRIQRHLDLRAAIDAEHIASGTPNELDIESLVPEKKAAGAATARPTQFKLPADLHAAANAAKALGKDSARAFFPAAKKWARDQGLTGTALEARRGELMAAFKAYKPGDQAAPEDLAARIEPTESAPEAGLPAHTGPVFDPLAQRPSAAPAVPANPLQTAHATLDRAKSELSGLQRTVIGKTADHAAALLDGSLAPSATLAKSLADRAKSIRKWDKGSENRWAAPIADAVDVIANHVEKTRPKSPIELRRAGVEARKTAGAQHAVSNTSIREVPIASLKLSNDVPQFKAGANAEGVVAPLGGKFERTGLAPIQVWQRTNGDLEIISGRHRFDLAKRSGERTIPAQIHSEAAGFDARQAATLDAILNIRDEQGSVSDYANYFRNSGISEEAAHAGGLLARAKGRAGFTIARDASADVAAAHSSGHLSDEAARAIAETAPGNATVQAVGLKAVQDGKPINLATNMMQAVIAMGRERGGSQQSDIFGFDDAGLRQAEAMAQQAAAEQRTIREQIAAVSGASKRPDIAKRFGVDVADPAGIQKRIAELRAEQGRWENWALHPELVAQLRDRGESRVAEGEPSEYGRASLPDSGHEITRGNLAAQESTHAESSQSNRDLALATPDPQGYSKDLFGNSISTDRGAARPKLPTENGNVHPAAEVSGKFATEVRPVKHGHVALGFERIQSAEQAAHVFAAMRKAPREHFAVLVLDKNDRPLTYLPLFSGAESQTSVYPAIVAKAVYQTPDAAKIWMAHNHPSGLPEPSRADRMLTEQIGKSFGRDLGIAVEGHVIIAGKRSVLLDSTGAQQGSPFAIPAAGRTYSVPITERQYFRTATLGPNISGPRAALEAMPKITDGKTGVVLLNAQHFPVAFQPMSIQQMSALRSGDPTLGFGALMNAAAKSGASAAMINFNTRDGTLLEAQRAAFNMGSALAANGRDVKLLDAFYGRTSMANEGTVELNSQHRFASIGRAGAGATSTLSDTLHAQVQAGANAKALLDTIAAKSESPLNKAIAQMLAKAGVNPTIKFGSVEDYKDDQLPAGVPKSLLDAMYEPDTNSVVLFNPRTLEHDALHELMHSAVYQATKRDGLPATQMKALYAHVKQFGTFDRNAYGLESVHEFIAEAFSNPEFQRELMAIPAKHGLTAKSAFDWFVNIVRSILGLTRESHTALSQALQIGHALVQEGAASKSDGVTVRQSTPEFLASKARDEKGRFISAAEDRLNELKARDDLLGKATNYVGDVMRTGDPLSTWNKTVGTQFGIAYAKNSDGSYKHPGFKKVFDRVQDYIKDTALFAMRAADLAPSILPKTDNMRQAMQNVVHAAQRAKDMVKVQAKIWEGTLISGREYPSSELKALGFTDRQVEMYEEARASINQSVQDLAATEMHRIAVTVKVPVAIDARAGLPETLTHYRETFRELIESTRTQLVELTDKRTTTEREREENAEAIEHIHARLNTLAKARDTINSLASRAAQLQSEGYAPLMRFGRHVVDVFRVGEDGKIATGEDGKPFPAQWDPKLGIHVT